MKKIELVEDSCNFELISIYLDSILHNLPLNLFWMDSDGRIISSSVNQAKVFGLPSAKELIGKNIFDVGKLLGWDDSIAEKLRANDLEIMRSKLAKTLEEVVIINGEYRTFLTVKSPLFNRNKEVIGVFGFSFDITERKKLEEELLIAKEKAETANKAKNEFLENMRHDIRTPLTGIVGFANLIKDETQEEKIYRYAENMVTSSNALLDFLNEVLEAVKVLSQEIPVIHKKFDLEEKIQQVIALNQAKAGEKKLDLQLQYDHTIPKYLLGDPTRLQRVVLELVTNALNFTHQGKIEVMVKLAKKEDRQHIIKIMVKDTGIGISADKKEEIFVKFKRLTPAYEGIYKGAGLGLAIVKQFITDLDGEIYVESQPNHGSTFTCVIPLKAPLLEETLGAETEIAEMPTKINYAEQQTDYASLTKIRREKLAKNRPARILIVEDQTLAAEVARTQLEHLNCSVDLAPDGASALEKAKTGDYDLIFMDIGLPDISGYEVTRSIREWEFLEDKHTPIIALTAHAEQEDKKHCIQLGMNAVLSKPLTERMAVDILYAFVPKLFVDNLKSKKFDTSSFSKQNHHIAVKSNEELFAEITGPVIDLALGAKLLNADEKVARNMIELLIKTLPQEITILETAYEKKDWQTIKAVAHKLRGGASYCGTPRLKAACANMEKCLSQKQQKLRGPLYQKMLAEVKSIEKVYLSIE